MNSFSAAKDVITSGFVVMPGDRVVVRPARPGLQLDVAAAGRAILAAALSPTDRVARLSVQRAQPERTTREARAMGITGRVAGYTTYYGGVANRIHNVQLVARLIDGAMIAPGATFSFNGTTGERSADKGFLEAPVIINGELKNGLGGGVCQVSTTVFNAAYEAGLSVSERHNHALYIDHYPLGRRDPLTHSRSATEGAESASARALLLPSNQALLRRAV